MEIPALPLDSIGPVCRTHLTLLDVPRMAGFEGATLLGVLICLGTLLPEPNKLHLVAFLGQHDVGFFRVLWCSLSFIHTRQPVLLE